MQNGSSGSKWERCQCLLSLSANGGLSQLSLSQTRLIGKIRSKLRLCNQTRPTPRRPGTRANTQEVRHNIHKKALKLYFWSIMWLGRIHYIGVIIVGSTECCYYCCHGNVHRWIQRAELVLYPESMTRQQEMLRSRIFTIWIHLLCSVGGFVWKWWQGNIHFGP